MSRLGLLMGLFLATMSAAAHANPKASSAPSPASCAPSEKLFQCHRRAVQLHVGLDTSIDLQAAKALYSSACEKNYAASCNNLGVLLVVTKAAPGNAAELFAKACERLDPVACDNARRLKAGAELAVKLSFPPLVFDDVAEDLVEAACRAGDAFQCSDAPTKTRVAALLAKECRAGEVEQCVDAALDSNDADYIELMTIACKQRIGKACYGLAKRARARATPRKVQDQRWRLACLDAEFDATSEEQAARYEACLQILETKQTPRSLLASVAKANEERCKSGEVPACDLARRAFDATGAAARAFAIAQHQCEEVRDCRDLSDRYALGRGTARSIPKALELHAFCDASRPWEVCRAVAGYLSKESPEDAAKILEEHCRANQQEACYLAARNIESAKTWCTEDVTQLHGRYSSLCALKIKDSCARKEKMCQLAQSELRMSRRVCEGGVGDGSFQPPAEYEAVEKLCPPARWNNDTKRVMQSLGQRGEEADTRPLPHPR